MRKIQPRKQWIPKVNQPVQGKQTIAGPSRLGTIDENQAHNTVVDSIQGEAGGGEKGSTTKEIGKTKEKETGAVESQKTR